VTVELREFIEARLAEDEALARACDPSAWRANGSWRRPAQYGAPAAQGGYVLAAAGEWHVLAKSYDVTPNTYHMARHDPARVLRDVEAKRRLINRILRYEASSDGEYGCCHDAEAIGRGGCPEINPNEIEALRLLALPYVDHPDYNPSWSPEAM
jgi:hypothetical protein